MVSDVQSPKPLGKYLLSSSCSFFYEWFLLSMYSQLRGEPQLEQKRALSGSFAPQFVQNLPVPGTRGGVEAPA